MINITKVWLFAALLAALPLARANAEPAASAWSQTDQTQVRLVAATKATGDAETLRFGLEFKLAPGWKIYWRSPGDAGLPPRLDWSGSRNFEKAAIAWPVPERFELFGLDTFGYSDEVVLPLDLQVKRKGEPLTLQLALDYLVCEKICIPYQAALALDLPAGSAQPSEFAHLIDRFVARVPGDGARAGLAVERAAWNGGPSPAITVTASSGTAFGDPDVFVEGPNGPLAGVSFGKPQVTRLDGARRVELRAAAHADAATLAKLGSLAGSPVTLTLVDGPRAMETHVTLAAGIPSASPIDVGFGAVLAIALLGGLILNLMPCVLPVLALKLLSVIGHAGAARAHIRRNFIASAAGIVASFAVLALALIALKLAGTTVGWGIQFQHPAFLIFMAVVLAIFTANLWGWIEFRTPGSVVAAAGTPGKAPEEETALGAFLSGAFATLLATPCSAPFVGTAVGFALARGPIEIVAVFLVLGLGLALPYLAVAVFPSLAAHLPRPGRWMLLLRSVLGIALLGTCAWLLSVLDVQTGPAASGATAGLLLLLLVLLWSMREATEVRRGITFAGAAILVVLTFIAPLRLIGNAPATLHQGDTAGRWQRFDLASIGAAVDQGRVVFVDVTADWCITCQVNKAAVLSRGDVAQQLSGDNVVAMRADWTRPDESIARYLASFGRYGIPFNVVYGPGAREGIPLPELLTSEAVLDALNKAEGAGKAESRAEGRP